jgi:protein-tyrosine phosphatase
VIDLHAHILPGVDDGPRTQRDAIEMATAALAAGTTTIAATPHVNERFRVHAAEVRRGVEALNAALEQAGVEIAILSGAEIALDRLLDLQPAELDELTLGGSGCLLIEPPLRHMPGDFEWPIRSLLERPDRRVLIAHPERCPSFMREPRRLHRLLEAGAYAQVTVPSLTGRFGPAVREFALLLVRCGFVHTLASDMHDAASSGPSLEHGLAVLAEHAGVDAESAAWLTDAVPRALLAGEAPPPRPDA